MSHRDYLCLSELKLFKNIKKTLPKNLKKTQNLITVHDGVVFTWDFTSNSILTLNLRAARSHQGDNVKLQTLLLVPIHFKPELLLVNERGTLLVVAAPSGLLVVELPNRYPPYGAFDHNKEIISCKSYTLDERLFLCSDISKVRQMRFHPASPNNNHLLVLTTANMLRLYAIGNGSNSLIATYEIGDIPTGTFPGTTTPYLGALGELAVDFDFGQSEISDSSKNQELIWPVYILRGNGSIFTISIPHDRKAKKEMFQTIITHDTPNDEACSILCFHGNAEIIVTANTKGDIYHYVSLSTNKKVLLKNLLCFEHVQLEMGLTTNTEKLEEEESTFPIFLNRDQQKIGRYYASHSAGVHLITIRNLQSLQNYLQDPHGESHVLNEIFSKDSKAEYLLCTKLSSSLTNNPIIGISFYYEPTSLIIVLSDGSLISLGIRSVDMLPNIKELTLEDSTVDSPLKKMLQVPFAELIQNTINEAPNLPVFKLSEPINSYKDLYGYFQRSSVVLREKGKILREARNEIEKRVNMLGAMKEFQVTELNRINEEKNLLQTNAERLAEKYEDIKDRQNVVMKRTEKLLVLVALKRPNPSDAEVDFLKKLENYKEKVEMYQQSIEKLNVKMNYQALHISQWKTQEEKKITKLPENQSVTIQKHLKETSEKISEMVNHVHEYKKKLNLK